MAGIEEININPKGIEMITAITKTKKGQTLEDDLGREYSARGRRDKRNKPQRGGGLKGLFRNKATDSQLGDVWEAN